MACALDRHYDRAQSTAQCALHSFDRNGGIYGFWLICDEANRVGAVLVGPWLYH